MENLTALSQIIQNVGLAIAALVGTYLAWQNLRPTVSQAEAARSQADLARRVHVAELFEHAVGNLADAKLEVRLGSIYILRYIAEDFPELARPVLELLTAHLRESVHDYGDAEPPVDVRAIMDILKPKVTT